MRRFIPGLDGEFHGSLLAVMNHTPQLTIVTVTKNDLAGLLRTVGSAMVWRRAGVEHIIVDGSDDPSSAIALANDADSNSGGLLRVVPRPARGISDAFNAGLAKAKGEWVWFLNGGDAVHETLEPEWLLSLLAKTRAQVVTGALHFDGETNARALPRLSWQWPLLACWLAHPATLVRRDRLLAVGGFDLKWRIAMDYDLWFRLLEGATTVDVLSVPFARFDLNGISQSRETAPSARREEASVVLRHLGKMTWAVTWLGLRLLLRLRWALWHSLFRPGDTLR